MHGPMAAICLYVLVTYKVRHNIRLAPYICVNVCNMYVPVYCTARVDHTSSSSKCKTSRHIHSGIQPVLTLRRTSLGTAPKKKTCIWAEHTLSTLNHQRHYKNLIFLCIFQWKKLPSDRWSVYAKCRLYKNAKISRIFYHLRLHWKQIDFVASQCYKCKYI